MADKLVAFIERARTWPQEAQEEAVASLQAIEDEVRSPYELSQSDKEAIDHGLADAQAGRFVPEEEVARIFARFRSA